jgi:hypothetical protein
MLYRLKPSDNRESLVRTSRRGRKKFRFWYGRVYSDYEIRAYFGPPHECLVFEEIGPEPPYLGSIENATQLAERCAALRAWIKGPVATKIDRSCKVFGGWTATEFAIPRVRALIEEAIGLGFPDSADTRSLTDERALLIALNRLSAWATKGAKNPPAAGQAEPRKKATVAPSTNGQAKSKPSKKGGRKSPKTDRSAR